MFSLAQGQDLASCELGGSFAVGTAFQGLFWVNGEKGTKKGESWQPGYKHPIQSVWRPHLALNATKRRGTSAEGKRGDGKTEQRRGVSSY